MMMKHELLKVRRSASYEKNVAIDELTQRSFCF